MADPGTGEAMSRRLGFEWVGRDDVPKIFEPNFGNDMPDQTPVSGIHGGSTRDPGSLGEQGMAYLVGCLMAAVDFGHIPVELWNKSVDSASRFERDNARRKAKP